MNEAGHEPAIINLDRADAYGAAFADVYDYWYHDISDPQETATFVLERCGVGPVLELGVGTGRLAQPLTDGGATVIGIDASAAMLSLCPVEAARYRILADMRSLPFRAGGFGAVLIAFNTLFNIASVQGQRMVLAECQRLLANDGVVILEAIDGSLLQHAPSESIGVSVRNHDGVVVSATTIDSAEQTIIGQHLQIDSDGIAARPWRLRWLTPSQLDELAAQVGLTRIERHLGWGAAASESPLSHVSVYR